MEIRRRQVKKKKIRMKRTAEAGKKKRFLRDVRTLLDWREEVRDRQQSLEHLRLELLHTGMQPGMADRIDANGHRYFVLPDDKDNEFKIERRLKTSFDTNGVLKILKKTADGRRFITTTVVGGVDLVRFLKRHGFKNFEVQESVTDEDIVQARQKGVLDDDDLRRLSTIQEIHALTLSPIRVSEEE